MRGNFFAVNSSQWHKVCDLGMNPACMYLVMCRGTGRDNKTTRWSATALRKYTAISKRRAQAARDSLIREGFVERTGSRNHPLYEIVRPSKENVLQDLIWLPNELITGIVDTTPPLERVRQTANVMCLRLFIDLYHHHNLVDDFGLSRECVYQEYTRDLITESGEYAIYGFDKSVLQCWPDHPVVRAHFRNISRREEKQGLSSSADFFKRLALLESLGLISFIPHLCESQGLDSEIMHPMIDALTSDSRLEYLTRDVSTAIIGDCHHHEMEMHDYVVPAHQHIEDVSLVGIGILRYRPKTALTAAGFANNETTINEWIEWYSNLPNHPQPMRRRGNTVV